jgi:HK97 family phage prohead protease
MERKGLNLEIKEDGAEQGAVTAIFSTFNVIDKDGDVTLPGAFEDGAAVRISAWGHQWYELPVGRGAIKAEEDRALLEGRFFMDTAHGLDTYRTVKGLAELQQWSYGYDVLESADGPFNGQQVRFLKKIQVHEVSPVMLGAGIDTGTLDVKAQVKIWEETENEIRHRIRDPEDFEADSFRRITIKKDKPRVFAVIGKLKGEDTTTVQALRFPKDDDWTIASAKKWLADHPDIGKGLSYEYQAEVAAASLADVAAFIARTRSLADLRAKDGRVLSIANRDRLAALTSTMRESLAEVEKLLAETDPGKASAVLQEYIRYQRTVAELATV